MTVAAQNFWDDRDVSLATPKTLSVHETHGGFAFSPIKSGFDVELFAEAILKFFSLVTILAAGAQWLLPDFLFSGNPFLTKVALMGGFMVVGAGLFHHANKGFRDEVQVDASRREVRLATRNGRDQASTRRRIAMRDVESCFMRRNKMPGQPAQLCLRLQGGAEPLPLVKAPEQDLNPILERMARDLKGPRQRVAARAV